MISYAAVDSIEGKFVRCELELMDIQESRFLSCEDKETVMVNVPLESICRTVESVSESDVFVVEHDAGKVLSVYYRDEEEMKRRIEQYREII